MATKFDEISYAELGQMLRSSLDGRRVFVSACEMASANLACQILPDTGCYSLISPKKKISFDDAAAFWVSFYHLILKVNDAAMKQSQLRRRIKALSKIFEEPISYFSSVTNDEKGSMRVA